MRASTGSGCFDMRFVHHEITYLETVEGPYGGSGPIIHSYSPKKQKRKETERKQVLGLHWLKFHYFYSLLHLFKVQIAK